MDPTEPGSMRSSRAPTRLVSMKPNRKKARQLPKNKGHHVFSMANNRPPLTQVQPRDLKNRQLVDFRGLLYLTVPLQAPPLFLEIGSAEIISNGGESAWLVAGPPCLLEGQGSWPNSLISIPPASYESLSWQRPWRRAGKHTHFAWRNSKALPQEEVGALPTGKAMQRTHALTRSVAQMNLPCGSCDAASAATSAPW